MKHRAIVTILVAACGSEPQQPDASIPPRQVVMETKSLLVGELAEGTLLGGAGDVAVISLDAPAATLDWNIHGHAGGDTQIIAEELDVMTVRYTFSPPNDDEWLLLLRNGDAAPVDIQVTLELYGDMQWSGWQ
jgi:hypothetical protein